MKVICDLRSEKNEFSEKLKDENMIMEALTISNL